MSTSATRSIEADSAADALPMAGCTHMLTIRLAMEEVIAEMWASSIHLI